MLYIDVLKSAIRSNAQPLATVISQALLSESYRQELVTANVLYGLQPPYSIPSVAEIKSSSPATEWQNALINAAAVGFLDVAKNLFAAGIKDVHSSSIHERMALYHVVERGDTEVLGIYYDAHKSERPKYLDEIMGDNYTALTLALRRGDWKMAKAIFKNGADFKKADGNGITPDLMLLAACADPLLYAEFQQFLSAADEKKSAEARIVLSYEQLNQTFYRAYATAPPQAKVVLERHFKPRLDEISRTIVERERARIQAIISVPAKKGAVSAMAETKAHPQAVALQTILAMVKPSATPTVIMAEMLKLLSLASSGNEALLFQAFIQLCQTEIASVERGDATETATLVVCEEISRQNAQRIWVASHALETTALHVILAMDLKSVAAKARAKAILKTILANFPSCEGLQARRDKEGRTPGKVATKNAALWREVISEIEAAGNARINPFIGLHVYADGLSSKSKSKEKLRKQCQIELQAFPSTPIQEQKDTHGTYTVAFRELIAAYSRLAKGSLGKENKFSRLLDKLMALSPGEFAAKYKEYQSYLRSSRDEIKAMAPPSPPLSPPSSSSSSSSSSPLPRFHPRPSRVSLAGGMGSAPAKSSSPIAPRSISLKPEPTVMESKAKEGPLSLSQQLRLAAVANKLDDVKLIATLMDGYAKTIEQLNDSIRLSFPTLSPLPESRDPQQSIDAKDAATDNTVLHDEAAAGHLLIIKELLEHKPNCSLPNKQRQTPLMLAAIGGHDPVVNMLLAVGVKDDVVDEKGRTALAHAAGKGDVAVVLTLLQRYIAAPFEVRSSDSKATLPYLDYAQSEPLISALIGANPTPPNLEVILTLLLRTGARQRSTDIWQKILTSHHDKSMQRRLLQILNNPITAWNELGMARSVDPLTLGKVERFLDGTVSLVQRPDDSHIQQAFYGALKTFDPGHIQLLTAILWQSVLRPGNWFNIFNVEVPGTKKTPLSFLLSAEADDAVRREIARDFFKQAKANLKKISAGDRELLEVFEYGADPCHTGSALHCAARLKHEDCLLDFFDEKESFADREIHADCIDEEGQTVLLVAAGQLHVRGVAAILADLKTSDDIDKAGIQEKFGVNKADKFGRTPLYMVARAVAESPTVDNITRAESLIIRFISAGANVNVKATLPSQRAASALDLLVQANLYPLIKVFLRACSVEPSVLLSEETLQRALGHALDNRLTDVVALLAPLINDLNPLLKKAENLGQENAIVRLRRIREQDQKLKDTRQNELVILIREEQTNLNIKPIPIRTSPPAEAKLTLFGSLYQTIAREQQKGSASNKKLIAEAFVIIKFLIKHCRSSAADNYVALEKIARCIAVTKTLLHKTEISALLEGFIANVDRARLELHRSPPSTFFADLHAFTELELQTQCQRFLVSLQATDELFLTAVGGELVVSPSAIDRVPETKAVLLPPATGRASVGVGKDRRPSSRDVDVDIYAAFEDHLDSPPSSVDAQGAGAGDEAESKGAFPKKPPASLRLLGAHTSSWRSFSSSSSSSGVSDVNDSPPSSPLQSAIPTYTPAPGVVVV
ncbi:hypothetical protein BH10PSE19_BH10PSE19_09560 [soil metagenome]